MSGFESRHTLKCLCCNRPCTELFCSIECACYSGRYSIKDGPINPDQPIKKRPPKKPWYLDDDMYLEYIAKFGWHYEGGEYKEIENECSRESEEISQSTT